MICWLLAICLLLLTSFNLIFFPCQGLCGGLVRPTNLCIVLPCLYFPQWDTSLSCFHGSWWLNLWLGLGREAWWVACHLRLHFTVSLQLVSFSGALWLHNQFGAPLISSAHWLTAFLHKVMSWETWSWLYWILLHADLFCHKKERSHSDLPCFCERCCCLVITI